MKKIKFFSRKNDIYERKMQKFFKNRNLVVTF